MKLIIESEVEQADLTHIVVQWWTAIHKYMENKNLTLDCWEIRYLNGAAQVTPFAMRELAAEIHLLHGIAIQYECELYDSLRLREVS